MPRYSIDINKSILYVLVKNDRSTVLAKMAHDHIIRASSWQGSIRWDPEQLSQSHVNVEVDVEGLRADEPESCEYIGYTHRPSLSDRRKTEENMRKKNQLDAKTHPHILFESVEIYREDPQDCLNDEHFMVAGNLTIRGMTKKIVIPTRIAHNDLTLSVQGRFVVTHQDFGFQPFSAPLGTLKNQDELTFEFDVVAVHL